MAIYPPTISNVQNWLSAAPWSSFTVCWISSFSDFPYLDRVQNSQKKTARIGPHFNFDCVSFLISKNIARDIFSPGNIVYFNVLYQPLIYAHTITVFKNISTRAASRWWFARVTTLRFRTKNITQSVLQPSRLKPYSQPAGIVDFG